VWTEYIDPEFRERAPRLVRKGDYDVYEMEEVVLPPIGMPGSAGKPTEDIRLEGRFEDVPKGAYEPAARLQAMDRDGVSAEIIYPTLAMRMHGIPDPALKRACFRAFNRWAAEFDATYPGRWKSVGVVGLDDAEWGAEELREVAELGLGAAFISVDPGGEDDYGRADYDRFWATAEELDLPVSLHAGSEKRRPGRLPARQVFTQRLGVTNSLAQMVYGGIFDRFPRLKIVSTENHVGWVPFFMQSLDHLHTRMPLLLGTDRPALDLLPSEYLRRNVYHAFIPFDTWWMPVRDRIGVDRILWSSDYPHSEGTWPESREVIAETFRGVPEEETQMMVGGNAAKLFGFD
jgi:predicted TIM-barrel fold metal-dependent hydrolase